MSAAIATVIAKRDLARARTMFQSYFSSGNDGQAFALIVDSFDGYIDPKKESFRTVTPFEIGISKSELRRLVATFTSSEVDKILRWRFARFLLKNSKTDVLYFAEPQVYFNKQLHDASQSAANAALVLVPRLFSTELTPNTTQLSSEVKILKNGFIDPAYLAISRRPESFKILDWIDARIGQEDPLSRQVNWLDQLPFLFQDVSVEKRPTFNVGYWNLAHVSNKEPPVILNLREYNPLQPYRLSSDSDIVLQSHNFISKIVEKYRVELLANGWAQSKDWPFTLWSQSELTNKLFQIEMPGL